MTSLDITLPEEIYGLYYYDHIGNISTSHAKRLKDRV